jgi:hypothetical protein
MGRARSEKYSPLVSTPQLTQRDRDVACFLQHFHIKSRRGETNRTSIKAVELAVLFLECEIDSMLTVNTSFILFLVFCVFFFALAGKVTGYEFNASWRGILIYALVLTSPSKINFLRRARGEWRNFVLLINYCQSRLSDSLNGKIIENHYGLPQLLVIKIKSRGIFGALRALITLKKSQKRIAKSSYIPYESSGSTGGSVKHAAETSNCCLFGSS